MAAQVAHVLVLHTGDHEVAFAVLDRRGDRIRKPFRAGSSHLYAIDHQFDVVHFVPIEPRTCRKVDHLSIHTRTQESLPQELLEQFTVMAFASADHRRQHEDLLAGIFLRHQVHDLFFGVAHHQFAGGVTVGIGHAREEQAQQIVDLGDRAHGAPRIAADRLLFDRDHRAQAADHVHVRPLNST